MRPPNQYPDSLNCVDVNLIDSETCNRPEHYKGTVIDGMFCAGLLNEGGKDACSGRFKRIIQLPIYLVSTDN